MPALLLLALGLAIGAGPAPGASACTNEYPTTGPFYAADHAPPASAAPAALADGGRTRVVSYVSYNIHGESETAKLVSDLRALAAERPLDVVLLQEVSGARDGSRNAADAIARALGMNYVYSPAIVRSGRDHGTAILSPWPIRDPRKILLPESPWAECRRRAPVTALVLVDGMPVQVYSVHLTTVVSGTFGSEEGRALQLEPVLLDADRLPEGTAVLVAGDLNTVNPFGTSGVRKLLRAHGFVDAHPATGSTFKRSFFDLDHAHTRGFGAVLGSGVHRRALGSDHYPIWGRLELTAAPKAALVRVASPAPP